MSRGGLKSVTFLGHVLILLLVFSGTVHAELGSLEFLQLRHQLKAGGATYEIGANQATDRSLRELCGLMAPTRWTPEIKYRLGSRAQEPIGASSIGTVALPSAFNWCSQGLCTPIRDQGSCGSCWAFATVAPLESNILIYEGKSVDLSEQYLVSCNINNWGCGGGWWAHDYHEWKYNASETEAGAVIEDDFAYTARNTTCGSPYNHPYKITDWAYVSSPFTVPPTEDIKRAIMTYGPVTAAVYVGSAFQYYRRGVFNTNVDAAVNHGIVIVGWDDNQGANGVWILRNSWGTGWGENGYMKIEYGASRVGYGASYVVYDPPPVQADFSADTTTGTDSLTVQFTDHSTGNPTAWYWTFGDGQTSTLKNPSHTYTNSGNYSVSLESSRPDSTDIIVKTDYITVAESTPPPPLVPPDVIELPAAGSYGYKAPGVLTNQSSVDFWFGGRTGNVIIECEFYDADYGDEIEILINGQSVGYAPRTANNSWGGIKYITLPDSYVSDSSANVLTMRNAYSLTYIWGIRDIHESEVFGVPPGAIELPAAGAYGYKAPGVSMNQSSVDFWFGARTGDVVIECEFYDADYGDEIEILINGQSVGYAPRTANNSWGGIKYITLPDSYVSGSSANVLTMRNAYSLTYIWGVRDIQESEVFGVPPGAIELPAAGAYGYKAPGVLTNQSSVDFWFGSRTGDVVIECEFYDADYGDEIEILINGQSVGYAPRTVNNSWGGIKCITLPDSYVSDSSENVLTMRNAYSLTYIWGVRDIQESKVFGVQLGVTELCPFGERANVNKF